MKKLSREELSNQHHFLSVGDLKKFLRDNPDLTDDAPVVVERIEDIYFKNNGWGVYLKEGDSYYWKSKLNEDMKEEIERRKSGLTNTHFHPFNPSSQLQGFALKDLRLQLLEINTRITCNK